MSKGYLPFHRKYRPSNISQYIGNDRVKKSVMAMLRTGDRPQVLLFQGHAGCGKTTMARLVASEYLCEDRDSFSGACGVCDSCKRLIEYIENGDSGGLMNVREIDIADSNKRQDIDEILEEAAVPTYDGSWRVYILDEFHQATNAAQNRLLKIAEEPPDKVLIVLCTTDPEKILPTIISRCQYSYKVTKPSRDELGSLLSKVCVKEGVKYDGRALSLICVKGDFVPRKALILLEQVIKEKGAVTHDAVVEVLSIVEDKYFFDFFEILTDKQIDLCNYVVFIGKVKESMDLKVFVENLLTFTLRGIYVNHGILVDALDKSEILQYKKLFKTFNPVALARLLDLLLNMRTSVDVEAKILLLGYTGLAGKSVVDTNTSNLGYLVDAGVVSVAAEKNVGTENFIKSVTLSDVEKEQMVLDRSKEVSADDIAKLFGGVKVYKTT